MLSALGLSIKCHTDRNMLCKISTDYLFNRHDSFNLVQRTRNSGTTAPVYVVTTAQLCIIVHYGVKVSARVFVYGCYCACIESLTLCGMGLHSWCHVVTLRGYSALPSLPNFHSVVLLCLSAACT